MVWFMPLHTGTKWRESPRGRRNEEMREEREEMKGWRKEKDNVLNSGGSYCAWRWTSHRGSQTHPGVAHLVLCWEPNNLDFGNPTESKPPPPPRYPCQKNVDTLKSQVQYLHCVRADTCSNGARHKVGRCRGRSAECARSDRKHADRAPVGLGAFSFFLSQCRLLLYRHNRVTGSHGRFSGPFATTVLHTYIMTRYML